MIIIPTLETHSWASARSGLQRVTETKMANHFSACRLPSILASIASEGCECIYDSAHSSGVSLFPLQVGMWRPWRWLKKYQVKGPLGHIPSQKRPTMMLSTLGERSECTSALQQCGETLKPPQHRWMVFVSFLSADQSRTSPTHLPQIVVRKEDISETASSSC